MKCHLYVFEDMEMEDGDASVEVQVDEFENVNVYDCAVAEDANGQVVAKLITYDDFPIQLERDGFYITGVLEGGGYGTWYCVILQQQVGKSVVGRGK